MAGGQERLLRRRITSVESTKKITRAMELIAASRIVKAQARGKPKDQEGGWRYQPEGVDSDLRVTGWQVRALRAARSAGCSLWAEPIEKAVSYIKRCGDCASFETRACSRPPEPMTRIFI